jgi:alkylation response protein AidB-like acyl-CoA dehydrogenase
MTTDLIDLTSAESDYNAWDDGDFRAEVRSWIEANYPPELRFPIERLHRRDTKIWYDRLAQKGWLAPGWPKDQGGMGLDPAKRILFIEELERHGCARYSDQGVLMIGPLLMAYGTIEQQQFFLPKILTGEHIWAQGYSEPDAGSDLASLRTEAVLDGDEWVINGQKTWTTLGNDANWIYVLVRTDKDAKKQQGISFVLVPMEAPGITVRPILTLGMSDEFCEIFFDNVRVPKDALVGGLNQGWTMAKTLLGFERIFVGSPAQSAYALSRLETMARHLKLFDDPDFNARYGRLVIDLADHVSIYTTFIEQVKRGDPIGADVSMLKINQTELYKRVAQTLVDYADDYAGCEGLVAELGGVQASTIWLQSLQTTIYGGTSEIQRDILAKQVLGLPS